MSPYGSINHYEEPVPVLALPYGQVSSLNNPQNSEMRFCENIWSCCHVEKNHPNYRRLHSE